MGDEVAAGQTLAIMEAMKIEHLLTAPNGGVVSAIHTSAGSSVDEDDRADRARSAMNARYANVLRERRLRVEAAWSSAEFDGPVLIPASLPIPIDGTDQFHEFHAHPEFQYLSGGRGTGSSARVGAEATAGRCSRRRCR